MKKMNVLILIPLLMAFQCDKEINDENDMLLETGIIGGWEISDETINGITDMTAKCCLFLRFYPDDNQMDYQGDYTYEETSANIDGTFVINQDDETITFQREGRDDLIYHYSITDAKDYLMLTFTENDAQFEQGWVKR